MKSCLIYSSLSKNGSTKGDIKQYYLTTIIYISVLLQPLYSKIYTTMVNIQVNT